MYKVIIAFLLSLICLRAGAQLCQGSLGDPIVNITFGAGTNPGAPLAAAATGYQYKSGDCPDDGFYTVTNSTTACFGNTWHSVPFDHTGNPNGYFMLINASIQPSAFYVDTVKGLCGNSTYEFAAWIMNVITPSSCNNASSQPNLTFTIETTTGTVLQTYNSGNIPPSGSGIWKQYGFFFTSPTGGSVIIRIVNNAAGGCGNDLALDDITFRPCGPLLTPSITGQPTNNANICEGTVRSFTFNCTVSGGFTNPAYQWQQRTNSGAWSDIAGQNTTTLNRNFIATTPVGLYEYRLSVAEAGNLGSTQCRISSQPVGVTVNANPVVVATNDGPACIGSKLTLTASGGTQYAWAGPNGFTAGIAAPVIDHISASQGGTYNVMATNAAGCPGSAATIVVTNPVPVAATAMATASICSRDSVQLSASGGNTYKWFPATGLSSDTIANPKASPATTTKYMVIAANTFGCTDTAYTEVTVFEKAFANAGPDKFLVEGQTVALNGTINGAYQSFSWSPPLFISNTQSLQPGVNPPADQTYTLTVISNNNCGTTTDVVDVKYYKGIFIPSAFTPNGDGINPTWYIPALNAFPGFELTVFNRYGQVVFRTSNANIAWDGKFKGQQVEQGVYTYVIDLKKAPGILKGTVMVLR